jgi:hypothetical protein
MTVIVPDATQSYGINWVFGSTGNILCLHHQKVNLFGLTLLDYVTLNFNVTSGNQSSSAKISQDRRYDQFYPVIHYYSAFRYAMASSALD